MKKRTIIIMAVLMVAAVSASYTQDYLNPLTRSIADTLYAFKGETDNDGNFDLFLNHSYKNDVSYNLNESDDDEINIHTVGGKKFVFGGTLV